MHPLPPAEELPHPPAQKADPQPNRSLDYTLPASAASARSEVSSEQREV